MGSRVLPFIGPFVERPKNQLLAKEEIHGRRNSLDQADRGYPPDEMRAATFSASAMTDGG